MSDLPDKQNDLFPYPLAPRPTALSGVGTDKNDPRRALDELVSRALAYRTGPELKALLEFTRRFPHIAPYNAMLLHVQNPGIAYALRAREWEREYKRSVKPAARPYVILWTMGPVAFVYDLSDTEPIDPAFDSVPESVKNPFPSKGQPPPGALARLMGACIKIGIEIALRDFGTQLAGRVQRIKKNTADFHIALNSKHTSAQQLGTLAHELAHIFCGHCGITKHGFWPDRSDTNHAVQEFEAETVAYFVTDRMNLDIGSDAYLSSYVRADSPLPNYSLDNVLKAVGVIEVMLAGHFRPKIRKEKKAKKG